LTEWLYDGCRIDAYNIEMLLELKHTLLELKQQLNHFFYLARDDNRRVMDIAYVFPYISFIDDDDNHKTSYVVRVLHKYHDVEKMFSWRSGEEIEPMLLYILSESE